MRKKKRKNERERERARERKRYDKRRWRSGTRGRATVTERLRVRDGAATNRNVLRKTPRRPLSVLAEPVCRVVTPSPRPDDRRRHGRRRPILYVCIITRRRKSIVSQLRVLYEILLSIPPPSSSSSSHAQGSAGCNNISMLR